MDRYLHFHHKVLVFPLTVSLGKSVVWNLTLRSFFFLPQLEGDLLLAPGFSCPPNLDYQGYHDYINENLPPETPYLYGLHPNAEIGFLTTTSENLFRTVLEMQPRDSSGAGASGSTREEQVSRGESGI